MSILVTPSQNQKILTGYGIERMSDIASVFFEPDAVSTYSDPDEIIIAHESNL